MPSAPGGNTRASILISALLARSLTRPAGEVSAVFDLLDHAGAQRSLQQFAFGQLVIVMVAVVRVDIVGGRPLDQRRYDVAGRRRGPCRSAAMWSTCARLVSTLLVAGRTGRRRLSGRVD